MSNPIFITEDGVSVYNPAFVFFVVKEDFTFMPMEYQQCEERINGKVFSSFNAAIRYIKENEPDFKIGKLHDRIMSDRNLVNTLISFQLSHAIWVADNK